MAGPANAGQSAAAGAASADDASRCPDCCEDGFARGQARAGAQLVTTLRPSASYAAVCPDGDLFLTRDGSDDIYRVTSAGEASSYVSLAGVFPGGIACDERHRFFVATFGLRMDAQAYDRPGILFVENQDTPPRMLPPPIGGETLAAPNGVSLGPPGTVYVMDTAAGMIVRVRETAPGSFESDVVASAVSGAVGAGYDPKLQRLYVTTGPIPGEILSFAVAADGSLSDKKLEWKFTDGAVPGALAVDERGTVYVADYFNGPVVRFPGAEIIAMVPRPSGLVFRGGKLLITEYYGAEPEQQGGLYEVSLGVCGAGALSMRLSSLRAYTVD